MWGVSLYQHSMVSRGAVARPTPAGSFHRFAVPLPPGGRLIKTPLFNTERMCDQILNIKTFTFYKETLDCRKERSQKASLGREGDQVVVEGARRAITLRNTTE